MNIKNNLLLSISTVATLVTSAVLSAILTEYFPCHFVSRDHVPLLFLTIRLPENLLDTIYAFLRVG